MSLLEFGFRRLGIEPRERALFGWGGLCLALLGSTSYALANASETLFLKRVGVDALPWALLASAGVLVATTGLAARWLANADRRVWLPRSLWMLALTLAPLWWMLQLWDSPWVFGAFVVLARQVLSLGALVFWLTMADLVTSRQAKRLFAPLSAGLTVGAIAGSFGSDPIARMLSLEGLVLIGALTLVGAGLAAMRMRPAIRVTGEMSRDLGAGPSRKATATNATSGFAPMWKASTLFRLLLVGILCGGVLNPVLFYEFSRVADAATQGPAGEQELMTLFAQFRGWLNVALLLSQLWLSARLYRGLGLPLSMSFEPAAYLLGFGGLGAAPSLASGLAALGSARVAETGITNAARRVLYNLFPESIRPGATAALEGPADRIGSVFGSMSVLGAIHFGAGAFVWLAALPIAAVWLGVSLVLRRAYPRLLLQASADRNLVGIGADKAQLLDRTTVRALVPGLVDVDPATCRAAIDLVRDAEPEVAAEVLAGAVLRAPRQNRSLLVTALHRLVEPLPSGSLAAPRAVHALEPAMRGIRDFEPDQRADLVQIYARLCAADPANSDEGSMPVLQRALGDREPAVRLAAMAELHRRNLPPPGVDDLDDLLSGAFDRGDILLRRSARAELRTTLLATQPDDEWNRRLELLAAQLGQRADRAETVEALVEVSRMHGGATHPAADRVVRFVHDRDPRVRAGVLRFIGRAGADEHAPRLVAGLRAHHAGVGAAAREGLLALGSKAIPYLLSEIELGRPSRRDAAIDVLRQLELEPGTLGDLYEMQLDQVRTQLMLRAALPGNTDDSLLLVRLEEWTADTIGSLLAVLSVLLEDDKIAEVERRLRRSQEERARDILIETLETVLPARVRADLIPLIESGSCSERGRRAAKAAGDTLPSETEAFAQLLEASDELIRRLARRFGPEAVESRTDLGDPSPVLDPMDVALQLRSVPAFDRLSARQLVRVAEALEQVRFVAGEQVFAQGDEGDGLYIVLEGEVSVSRGKGLGELSIGPGEFFGELSTLDGDERSETALASGDVRLLRLDREELLVLMEDAPALAIGLCQLLSLRVRTLQDQIGSA